MTEPLRILAFDIASTTGFAFYDTSLGYSEIISGIISTKEDAAGIKEKYRQRKARRRGLKEAVRQLLLRYRPDAVCLELPLGVIKTYGGRAKSKPVDLFSEDEEDEGAKGGPNASTVLTLNHLYVCVDETVKSYFVLTNRPDTETMEVSPSQWQTLTKRFHGADTKARSKEFCRAMKIPLPDFSKKDQSDAADACVIAIWAETEARRLMRAGEAVFGKEGRS